MATGVSRDDKQRGIPLRSSHYRRQGRRPRPIGTGFFVDIPREGIDNQRPSAAPGPLREPATCRYLITTRHVLNGQTNVEVIGWSRAGGHLGPFPVPDWRVPDESLDLAIAPFRVAPTYSSGLSLSPSGIQLNVIPNTFFATHPRFSSHCGRHTTSSWWHHLLRWPARTAVRSAHGPQWHPWRH